MTEKIKIQNLCFSLLISISLISVAYAEEGIIDLDYDADQEIAYLSWDFSWNYNAPDVMNYHVPNDLIIVDVNATNPFNMKAHGNQGVNNFKGVKIGFSLENVGDPTNEADVLLQIIIDDEIEEIIVYDDEFRMMLSSGSANLTECGYVSSLCMEITGHVTFREPLKYNVIVIQAVDKAGNTQTNFINDEINAEGESINEVTYHKVSENRFDRTTPDTPRTIIDRYHSEFYRIVEFETKRAVEKFDSRLIQGEIPTYFSYDYPPFEDRMVKINPIIEYEKRRALDTFEKNYN